MNSHLDVYQEHHQRLAWHLEDIIKGRGLAQPSYSIVGGRGWRVPQVVSVIAGPPVAFDVRILPGQTPDDFAAHASAIAYGLGVAEVQVVSLGPALIRLQLLPKPA
jgi:hypothetical protein